MTFAEIMPSNIAWDAAGSMSAEAPTELVTNAVSDYQIGIEKYFNHIVIRPAFTK